MDWKGSGKKGRKTESEWQTEMQWGDGERGEISGTYERVRIIWNSILVQG